MNCSPVQELALKSLIIRNKIKELDSTFLEWKCKPLNALLVYKDHDPALLQDLPHYISKLKEFVDVYSITDFPGTKLYSNHSIDFIVSIGGDGTVLLSAWLFQQDAPPILPFFHGSLGFLTAFQLEYFEETLKMFLNSELLLGLRSRLECEIRNADKTTKFSVLNEVVVDRGMSTHMSLIDIYVNKQHLTRVQADGIVFATPTGSTAYSLSAGGPITSPQIPTILISPICPHSLSFRPILLPDTVELEIQIAQESRSDSAWLSFDGKERVELTKESRLFIRSSLFPVFTACEKSFMQDWFHGVTHCLRWNESGKRTK